MDPKIKLGLYVVLISCMVYCGIGLLRTYRSGDNPAAPSDPHAAQGSQGSPPSTTNMVVTTNAAGLLQTNLQAVPAPAAPVPEEITARHQSPRLGRMMAYGVTLFFALVGLAALIGFDTSRYVADRVDDFIFNDDLKGVKDPAYEEAEHVHASGRHLEAIQLMRDYLKQHPREQYVALRIAEIYESDLHNYLAAALEYEEVLKKRLPPERWGWAAIHLANLYSGKLNKSAAATVLLRRIAEEYGQTAAARKARERLGLPEPVEVPEPVPEPPPPSEPPPPEPPPSNLPKGFRPKS